MILVGDNKKKLRFGVLIMLYFAFFITDSAFINYTGNGYTLKVTLLMLAPLFVCFFISNKKKTAFYRNELLLMLVIMLIISVSSFLGGAGFRITLSYIGTLLFAYIFVKRVSFDEFKKTFVFLIMIVSVVSLSIYILLIINKNLMYIFPTVQHRWGNGTTTAVELIFTSFRHVSGLLRRNYGMFWEPGVFQAYLNLALLFIFTDKESPIPWIKVMVLIVNIITTFSTTGFIVLGCNLILCILLKVSNPKNKIKSFLGILLISIILIMLYINNADLLNTTLFDKFEQGNNSYESRFFSIWGNILVFIQKPFLGVGFGMSAYALNQLGISTSGTLHQTNTFTNYFASFGVFVGAVYVASWCKLVKKISSSILEKIIVFIIIIIITSGENFIASVLFTIVMMYGFIPEMKNNIDHVIGEKV